MNRVLAVGLAVLLGAAGCGLIGDGGPTTAIPQSDVAIELAPVADGFATPLWGASAPGDEDHLFVVDQVGTVTGVPVGVGTRGSEPFLLLDVGAGGLDLIVGLPFDLGFDERGLLGLAFHPAFVENGLFYTYTIEPLGPEPDFTTLGPGQRRRDDGGLSVLREWTVRDPGNVRAGVDPDSRVLLRVEQPQPNHNGGALVFDDAGRLFVALGDGGGRDDQGPGHAPGGNGQDLSPGNLLGKILRIDPLGRDSLNGQYGIPADNPFVESAASDEIWAYGFRNPFRIAFDAPAGVLYAADVGQADIEEVNIVVRGGNHGWPVKEGTFRFDDNGDERGFAAEDSPGDPAGLIDPIAQYSHDEGISVTGGFVYRGDAIAGLQGRYVFADLARDGAEPSGRLFHLDSTDTIVELVPSNADDARLYITGFGQGPGGELYVMGLRDAVTAGSVGEVYRITPG